MKKYRTIRISKQSGASLIFTLIATLILLLAATISINAVRTQQSAAGDLAIRQEMLNHAEWVIAKIIEDYNDPSKSPNPNTNNIAYKSFNYSPHVSRLEENSNEIPPALLEDEPTFKSSYGTKFYVVKENSDIKVTHYVERMCEESAPADNKIPSNCLTTGETANASTSDNEPVTLKITPSIIYRISLRVDGPRNAQIFIQSSFVRDIKNNSI